MITLGSERIDTTRYERRAVPGDPAGPRAQPAQALADVRNGATIAALIIPPDLPQRLASGVAVRLRRGDLQRRRGQPVAGARRRSSRSSRRPTRCSPSQLEQVAGSYIDLLLTGGKLSFLGSTFDVLGPARTRARSSTGCSPELPQSSPLHARLAPVAELRADRGREPRRLKAVIGAVAAPIVVRQQVFNGRRTPLDNYAVAVAVAVSLMFVCVLLASGHARPRARGEHASGGCAAGSSRPARCWPRRRCWRRCAASRSSFAMLCRDRRLRPARLGPRGLWLRGARSAGALAFAALGVAIGRAGARRARRLAAGAADLAAAGLSRARPGRRGRGRPLRRDPRDLGGLPVQGGARGDRRGRQPVAARACWRRRSAHLAGADRRLRRARAGRAAALRVLANRRGRASGAARWRRYHRSDGLSRHAPAAAAAHARAARPGARDRADGRRVCSRRCSSPRPSAPIEPMPGVSRLSISGAVAEAGELAALGVPGVLLFGIPDDKDAEGSGAWDDEGASSSPRARSRRRTPSSS